MDPYLEKLSAALGDAYSIGARIGEGGTASVYQATDLRHGREVAVKVLKPDVAKSIGPERFLNEIETTAALQHPHVLPLFDSGSADGLVYFVTPLVEGRTLKDRLKEGPLDIVEAVQLTEQIASALSYAHDKGLVHRDVKPANILMSSGRAVLSDFGISRALSEAGGERLTATGVSIGTPEYMSPEQIEGGHIDSRADLYSLGCVVFEMLTGEPPVTGKTAQSVFARRLTSPAPSARSLRDTVPAGVDSAVSRAMAKQPTDRFQTVEAFGAAITSGMTASAENIRGTGRWWPAVGALAVVAAGVALWPDSVQDAVVTIEPDRPWVAVHPFVNGGDADMQGLVTVMHQDVIGELQALDAVRVIATMSSTQAAESAQDLQGFADLVHADLVLTPMIVPFGDSVRIGAELLDMSTNEVVRTLSLRGSRDGLSGLVGEFVLAVADSLEVDFAPQQTARLASMADVDPRAYELYLRAEGASMDPQGLLQKEELLRAAIDRAPGYADAWYKLGAILVLQAHNGIASPEELIPQAMAAGDSALRLDPNGRALSLFAHIAYDFEFDWEKADSLNRVALELHPSAPEVHQVYGAYLTAMGRFDEAEVAMRAAAELDPLNPFWTATIAWPMVTERPEEALDHLNGLPSSHQTSFPARWMRRMALSSMGRHEEIVIETEAGNLESPGRAGVSYALSGRIDRARGIVGELEALRRNGYFSGLELASIHLALGDVESALSWLEQAYEERDDRLAHMREIPVFERLSDEPRYQALMARMAFPARSSR